MLVCVLACCTVIKKTEKDVLYFAVQHHYTKWSQCY